VPQQRAGGLDPPQMGPARALYRFQGGFEVFGDSFEKIQLFEP